MGFFSSITKPFKKAWDAVSDVASNVWDGVTGVVGDVVDVAAPLLGTGAQVAGQIISGTKNAEAESEANEANLAFAREQFDWQKEYAKNRVQWQLEDAKNAGLHPMVAAGLSPTSFSPVSASQSPIDYDWVGQVGQSLAYAGTKAKTNKQQQIAFDYQVQLADEHLSGMRLDNELKVMEILSMISRLNQAGGPAAPNLNGGVTLLPGQNDSPYMDKPIVSNGFRLDEKGRKIDIIPSDALKSRTEDVFGVEWMPFIDSAKLNYATKVQGKSFAGHWWHDDKGEFLPYPPKEKRNARQNNQDSYYHNSWRYR